MEHYSNNQYEDDLTVGADDYEDMLHPGDIDLFAFQDEEASPILQLKWLVLSLDWEITDEVLLRFEEELVDLGDVWADDKVRLVYVQALKKIGRYIYRYKADAHRDAINVLLAMYQNLEKIVLSEEISDEDVVSLLKTDIAKFERLKKVIFNSDSGENNSQKKIRGDAEEDREQNVQELVTLKALVLGIDWEITKEELLNLQHEIERLQSVFAQNPVWLIFLQGIGLLGRYVRKLGSNAHSDVFGLFGSFYQGLEQVVGSSLSFDEQKKILLQEVDKFNAFKALVLEKENGSTFSEDAEIVPALADLPENEGLGFHEEDGAFWDDSDSSESIEEFVDQFFGEKEATSVAVSEHLSVDEDTSAVKEEERDTFWGTAEESAAVTVDKETALLGVNVESEADEETESENPEDIGDEEALAFTDEEKYSASHQDISGEISPEEQLSSDIAERIDAFFTDIPGSKEDDEQDFESGFVVPADVALQGVDVEVGDDEDEEESDFQNLDSVFDETSSTIAVEQDEPFLTETGGDDVDVAPALSGFADVQDEEFFDSEGVASVEELDDADVAPALSGFADVQDEESFDSEDVASVEELDDADVAPALLDVVDVQDEESFDSEDVVSVEELDDADVAPALSDAADVQDEESFDSEDVASVEELDDADVAPALSDVADVQDEGHVSELVEQDLLEESVHVGTGIFGSVSLPGAEESRIVDNDSEISPFEMLRTLGDGVQALTLDQDNSVIPGLFATIDSLHKLWAEMPLHRSYLELVSVVVQHIDRYHYERSSDTLSLLLDLVENVKEYCDMDASSEKFQKSLREDMHAVLSWQQKLVSVYSTGLPEDEIVVDSGEDEDIASVDTFISDLDDIDNIVNDDAIEDAGLEEALDQELGNQELTVSSDDEITSILREEIVALREFLQQEIAELRSALKKED